MSWRGGEIRTLGIIPTQLRLRGDPDAFKTAAVLRTFVDERSESSNNKDYLGNEMSQAYA
jgi:hypothetical protein